MDLVLLVGTARSGTTLLSQVLDAHPAVGCPPEGGLPGLLDHSRRAWSAITGDAPADLGPPALMGMRETIEAPVRFYLEREQKQIYCDKSLDSVYFLDQVQDAFPRSRYILLFRHPMDVIASGIDASPWGFTHYGYQGYIQGSPGNFVAPLAQHWLSHVDAALGWRTKHPGLCLTVRYEDLVTAPNREVAAIFSFLGVERDDGVLDRTFTGERRSNGPGDHKFAHTHGIHEASIGHGKRVPVELVPPVLLQEMNRALSQLGYAPVDAAWNFTPLKERVIAGEPWRDTLQGIMAGSDRPAGPSLPAPAGEPFAVVADDDPGLRWVVQPGARTITAGDGEVAYVIAGSTEDLVRLVRGDDNAGAMLRRGAIRHGVAAGSKTGKLDTERDLRNAAAVIRALSKAVDG